MAGLKALKQTVTRIVGSFFLVFVGFFFLIFSNSFFVIINAGEVGVVSTLGKVADNALDSGFHLKNPLATIERMSVRTSSYTMSSTVEEGEVQGDDSIKALASDGGVVWFDVTVLYKLDPKHAPSVYSNIGRQYEDKIIRPLIRSTIREVASKYSVKEIYSTKRDEIQGSIFSSLEGTVGDRGIIMEDVLLRKVTLTDSLLESIEKKLASEQEVQRQEFEIQKAEKAADRKRVEAKGQRDAQAIINESLTSNYLYYLYVNDLKSREGTIYVPVDPSTGLPVFKGIE